MFFDKMDSLEELFFDGAAGSLQLIGNLLGRHVVPGIHKKDLSFTGRQQLDGILGNVMVFPENERIISGVGRFGCGLPELS